MSFPYTAILKQAYGHTVGNFQIWVFGIFVSFASGFVFFAIGVLFNLPTISQSEFSEPFSPLLNHWQTPWVASDITVLILVFIASAVSKASLVWAAQKLASHENVLPRLAFTAGSKFVFTVLAIQLLLLVVFVGISGLLALPISYLVLIGEIGRAIALGILGLAIFVPASILVGLMLIYAPIIAVLYEISARSALSLAFTLARNKLKESLVMAALMSGIFLGFIVACGFGIILLGVPAAFLFLLFTKIGLYWAVSVLLILVSFLAFCSLVVCLAGMAVFSNIAWTLAVIEMIKVEKIDESAKALAPEAEPAS